MIKWLLYISYSFFFAASAVTTLGLSTYFWKEVDAHIEHIEKTDISTSGYPSTPKYRANQGYQSRLTWLSIRYSYKVDKSSYSSNFSGFYAPINLDIEIVETAYSKKKVKAYYFPYYPKLAVVKTGFGYTFVLLMVFLGFSSLLFRNLLIKYISLAISSEKESSPQK